MAEDRRPRDDKSTSDKRPKDTQDNKTLGEPGTISGGGRAGGRLARDIGTRDELKRARERPAGVTRVRKSDEHENENG